MSRIRKNYSRALESAGTSKKVIKVRGPFHSTTTRCYVRFLYFHVSHARRTVENVDVLSLSLNGSKTSPIKKS